MTQVACKARGERQRVYKHRVNIVEDVHLGTSTIDLPKVFIYHDPVPPYAYPQA